MRGGSLLPTNSLLQRGVSEGIGCNGGSLLHGGSRLQRGGLCCDPLGWPLLHKPLLPALGFRV